MWKMYVMDYRHDLPNKYNILTDDAKFQSWQ